ncbi:MAG TPA: molybdopterin cofactor-binding domain-containing protein, partial [Gemmatimonadales bacterium]|nr:molybdopterin cofactor-binding domain-containing protein [Gemmatimonadales bacterium]
MIGQPIPRLDGPAKVTGAAPYAADQAVPNLLHAVIVTAAIPAGRVTAIDDTEALRERGVIRVLTQSDLPRLNRADAPMMAQTLIPMQSDEIRHEGQPVAIVLGETLEAAEAGAHRARVRYEPAKPRLPVGAEWEEIDQVAVAPKQGGFLFFEPTFAKGDPGAGLAAGDRRFEAAYLQPSRHHNPMEPSATLAVWEGDNLTLYDATQHVYGVQRVVATVLGIPPERVRVISSHTGGGFGVKGWIWPHEILAPVAAKVVGRPVKLVLTRSQMYSMLGYQPRTVQKVALGSDAAGRLTAVTHDVVNLTAVT